MVNYQAVGTFISKLRKTKGLTQMEFAECLNVTHQAVSKWENGITLPDTETLFALSKQFKVKVDDILNGNISGFMHNTESCDNIEDNQCSISGENTEIRFEFGLGIIPFICHHLRL